MFQDGIRHFYLVLHRRAGKDKETLQLITMYAMQRAGLCLYVFPHLVQARKAIWKGRGDDGVRFIDHIPPELVVKKNELEMSVELVNGSIIQLTGSSNIDALVGSNPILIAYSEFPLHNPMARQLLSPILAQNKGVEILNGTPRGRGPSYDIFKHAQNSPEWFTQYLTVEDTKKEDGSPVITQEDIDSFRRSGMTEEMIQQEFYCSWDSGNVGAYYTDHINKADMEKRICVFEIIKSIKVITVWDLGISDATAIWFMQPCHDGLKMVYYYEATGKGFDHYAQVLAATSERFGFKYLGHFAPHDVAQRQWGASTRSTLRLAQESGIHFQIVPNVSIEDGIGAVMSIFPQVWFHAEYCVQGIEGLRHYQREYDFERRTFKTKPLHNWASHCADAFRYFAVVWKNQFMTPHLNQPKKYEMNF